MLRGLCWLQSCTQSTWIWQCTSMKLWGYFFEGLSKNSCCISAIILYEMRSFFRWNGCLYLWQINASDDRVATTLKGKILDAIQMKSVMGENRPNCLVSTWPTHGSHITFILCGAECKACFPLFTLKVCLNWMHLWQGAVHILQPWLWQGWFFYMGSLWIISRL